MGADTNNVKVTCMENGPYLFEGLRSIKNAKGEEIQLTSRAALCRCGESSNKPFCDGTHGRAGFASQKLEGRTQDKRDDYVSKEITIHDNRGICAHSGFCTDSLKSVFRIDKEPFVDPDGASTEEIIAAIEKCPSGALSYSVNGEEQVFSSDSVSVYVAPNGPYAIQGKVELKDTQWNEGAFKEKFDLCRCGDSKNKPFCDGSHWKKHFDQEAPDPTQ